MGCLGGRIGFRFGSSCDRFGYLVKLRRWFVMGEKKLSMIVTLLVFVLLVGRACGFLFSCCGRVACIPKCGHLCHFHDLSAPTW